MENVSDRPRRSTEVLAVFELVLDRAIGEYGCLELVTSSDGDQAASHSFWPLDKAGRLSPTQLADAVSLVGQELSEALYTKISVQGELFSST